MTKMSMAGIKTIVAAMADRLLTDQNLTQNAKVTTAKNKMMPTTVLQIHATSTNL